MPCAIAAALLATPSHALMLGEPQVRSYLGRPLDVRIPVQGAGADAADASCFEVLGEAARGPSTLSLAVEQQGARTWLRVRTSEPVAEPATVLILRAACPPSKGALVRQYGILLDPMPASMPSAPLVAAEAAEEIHVAQGAPASEPAAATPLARARPGPAAPRTHHARREVQGPSLARSGFHLKLSGPVLDLEPSRNITEAQRAQLREAHTLMDGDDYASAMLALRDRIETLQKRLDTLQSQAVRMEATARPPSPVAAATPKPDLPSLGLAQGAWWWALVALLGLAALLMPLTRWMRRRKPGGAKEREVKVLPPEPGTETGRFAPPPPHVLAPALASRGSTAANAAPIGMEDTEDAIRSARDLYDAGERLQAAGVLRLAIESHPERVAPWLPLFDLLMRERLAAEYAELARGFRALHGSSPAWKAVQRAGQQLDPANPLYEEDTRQVAA